MSEKTVTVRLARTPQGRFDFVFETIENDTSTVLEVSDEVSNNDLGVALRTMFELVSRRINR